MQHKSKRTVNIHHNVHGEREKKGPHDIFGLLMCAIELTDGRM